MATFPCPIILTFSTWLKSIRGDSNDEWYGCPLYQLTKDRAEKTLSNVVSPGMFRDLSSDAP